jgi:hypothetical protein
MADGALMATLTEAVAVLPWSSETRQVMFTVPVGTPAEAKTALAPLPLMLPAEAE